MKPNPEADYQQRVWDTYRTDRELLLRAGVQGAHQMEEALASTFVVHAADLQDDPGDTDILLGTHVLHMLAATSAGLQG